MALLGLPYQRRQGLGWMLQVVVQADDELAGRRSQSGEQRGMLPAIARQRDHRETPVNGRPLPQDSKAAVTAAIVDRDHLVRPSFPLARLHDAVDRLADHLGAVVDGDDDGDHGSSVTRPAAPSHRAWRRAAQGARRKA